MVTQYELEIFVKEYQEMRLKQREEAMKQMLIQPEPRWPFQMRLRLPKFILKWIQQEEGCDDPLQECPELA